jgi:hypothetical protein
MVRIRSAAFSAGSPRVPSTVIPTTCRKPLARSCSRPHPERSEARAKNALLALRGQGEPFVFPSGDPANHLLHRPTESRQAYRGAIRTVTARAAAVHDKYCVFRTPARVSYGESALSAQRRRTAFTAGWQAALPDFRRSSASTASSRQACESGPGSYSCRSAVRGSMRAARRAGSQDASAAMAPSSTTTLP